MHILGDTPEIGRASQQCRGLVFFEMMDLRGHMPRFT